MKMEEELKPLAADGQKFNAALRLMRPANIVTSFADVLAGFGIAGVPFILVNPGQMLHMLALLVLLLLATACLYGGGVVMNDACDAELDRIERPERPIPTGIISGNQATLLGVGLMLCGIALAFLVSDVSGFLALTIGLLSLFYDAYSKPFLWLGPLNMGLCRSVNLLLGISIVTSALATHWLLMVIPLTFIFAVTLISKGEVQGGSKSMLSISLALYILTTIIVLLLGFRPNFHLLVALPFLVAFCYLTLSSLLKAIKTLEPREIRLAVKTGIIGLIILDASIAAGYAGFWYGLFILILLPISIGLAKKFAVT